MSVNCPKVCLFAKSSCHLHIYYLKVKYNDHIPKEINKCHINCLLKIEFLFTTEFDQSLLMKKIQHLNNKNFDPNF